MTIKKRHDILTISMLAGTAAALLTASFTSFANQCEEISNEVLRLHIVANSNEEYDQELKYKLRDYLISDMEIFFNGIDSLDNAKATVEANLSEIEENVQDFIAYQGYDYSVSVSLENMYFTTRVYENITMPAGNYDALRVEIGEAEGKNWWCVIFPPLCLPACTEKDEPYFSAEASKLIESGGGKIEVRFAVYEWFAKKFKK